MSGGLAFGRVGFEGATKLGLAGLLLLVLHACDGSFFFADPASAPASVEIQLVPGPGLLSSTAAHEGQEPANDTPALQASRGGSDAIFDGIDFVRVQVLSSETEGLLAELERAVTPSGGEIRLSVPIELEDDEVPAWIEVELRSDGVPFFLAGSEVLLRRGRPTAAELPLEGIAAELRVPLTPPTLEAIGDTLELVATALFSTGDTIRGVNPTWISLDPEVVQISSNGIAVAQGEGDAQLQVWFQSLSEELILEVSQVVEQMTLAPGLLELTPGETAQLEALPRDRRGHLVEGRSIAWTSTNSEVAIVNQNGEVQGQSSGSAQITADLEGIQASAEVTVSGRARLLPAPIELYTYWGEVGVSLSWYYPFEEPGSVVFEVQRSPWDGETTPSNWSLIGTTSTEWWDDETAIVGTNYGYRVRACDGSLCSDWSDIALHEWYVGELPQ